MDYNPFEAMKFSYENCFLCGVKLNENNNSDEHVFPKWLLHKYNLWNKTIHLLNNTQIKYKDIKIPCCKKCNNQYLSNIEKEIESGVTSGFNTFNSLDLNSLSKWLLKISYGMLFKELSLKLDRKDSSLGNITTEELLKSRNMVHVFLQGIKVEMNFSMNVPWSLLKFKLLREEESPNFDFGDIITNNFMYTVMDDIGVIFCYGDNGIGKEMFDDQYSYFYDFALHPVQFYELCAKVFYKNSLFNKNPSYTIIAASKNPEKIDVISHNVSGIVFNDWDQFEYSKILDYFIKRSGYNAKIEFIKPDKVSTFLCYNSFDNYIRYNSLELNDFEIIKK